MLADQRRAGGGPLLESRQPDRVAHVALRTDFSVLELHLYNLRHIQQHTGELYERLGASGLADLGWVSTGKR